MGRKAVVGAVLVLSVAIAGVAGAGGRQRVEGRVLVPTSETCSEAGFVAATLGWVYPGTNGTSHYFFRVQPDTRGEAFTLTAVADVAADLDITFTGEGRSRAFRTRGANEAGAVPAWADLAEICAYAGVDVRFVYLAG